MTVGELLELLADVPKDIEVLTFTSDERYGDYTEVKVSFRQVYMKPIHVDVKRWTAKPVEHSTKVEAVVII
jgi:hypothetical protein